MNKVLISALVTIVACATAQEPEHQMDVKPPQQSTAPVDTVDLLNDNGGRILPSANLYAVWWGPSHNFPSDYKAGLQALLTGMDGSSWQADLNEYMRGATITSSFVTNWTDRNSPPTSPPNVTQVVSQACGQITANHATPDPAAIYFMLPTTFPTGMTGCGWHGSGTCGTTTIQVAFIPNLDGVAGCNPGDLYGCNTYSEATRASANVLAHEYAEAATDADFSAWFDVNVNEVADKCVWQFSGCSTLGSTNWQLQELWSNAASGCVL